MVSQFQLSEQVNRLVYGSEQAQALANYVWGIRFFEYTLLPPDNSSNKLFNPTLESKNEEIVENPNALTLIPNPASNKTSIKYKLPNNALTGKIIITDINGRQVQYYEIIASLSSVELNTSNYLSGVYFVNLYSNNELVKTKKLVIIK